MLKGLEEILAKHELSDEIKAALLADVNSAADGLSLKNAELLQKISANKDAGTASAAELEALQLFKKNSDLKSAEDASSYADAKQLTADSHAAEMLKLTEQIKGFTANEETRLITDGINSQLTEAKINPLFAESTLAMFKSQSKLVDGKAMIGDITQSEAIAKWAQTDSGKASCLAQENSGGDGLGGKVPGQQDNTNKAAETAKANGDVQAYLAATAPQPT